MSSRISCPPKEDKLELKQVGFFCLSTNLMIFFFKLQKLKIFQLHALFHDKKSRVVSKKQFVPGTRRKRSNEGMRRQKHNTHSMW